jgi:hypothetical protein
MNNYRLLAYSRIIFSVIYKYYILYHQESLLHNSLCMTVSKGGGKCHMIKSQFICVREEIYLYKQEIYLHGRE